MIKPLDRESLDQRRRDAWLKKEAERVFTISGTLKQPKCSGAAHSAFRRDLQELFDKYGITAYPYCVVTVIREDGKPTPIAQP